MFGCLFGWLLRWLVWKPPHGCHEAADPMIISKAARPSRSIFRSSLDMDGRPSLGVLAKETSQLGGLFGDFLEDFLVLFCGLTAVFIWFHGFSLQFGSKI